MASKTDKAGKNIRYGFTKRVQGSPFDPLVERVTAALKAEGFGVLTSIDVKETLKNKLGADFRRYTILGACNPQLAHKALSAEPHLGLLLPCNVVVQEAPDGDGFLVSAQDPRAMFSVVENPALRPVMEEAEQRLGRVMEGL